MTALALAERLAAGACVVAAVLAAFRYVVARGSGVRRAVARGPGPRRERELAVLESAMLPNGASLHLVRAGTRRFVVGRSGTSIAALGEAGDPLPEACPGGVRSAFTAPQAARCCAASANGGSASGDGGMDAGRNA